MARAKREVSAPSAPSARSTPPQADAAAPASFARDAVAVTVLCLLLLLAVKMVVRDFPHQEPDELVYWQLAGRWAATGEYTLRGTEVLPFLPPGIYDRPYFHHPWLFPALLVPFAKAGAMKAAIAVPWAGHGLAVVAVALLGVAILRERGAVPSAFSPRFWLPVLAMAFDPVLLLLSRRIWMDSLLSGLAGMAVALAALGVRRERGRGLLVASGVALGLATLVKMPGLLALPVVVFLVLARRRGRERAVALGCTLGPWALLSLPWFFAFARVYGRLAPNWLSPDADSIARFPFVRAMLARPVTYYVAELALVQPLLVLLVVLALARWRRLGSAILVAPLLWAGVGLLAFSLLGVRGLGFQMRYLCPMLPALYAGLYAVLPGEEPRPSPVAYVALLLVLYAGATGLVNMVTLVSDDLVDLFSMASRLAGT